MVLQISEGSFQSLRAGQRGESKTEQVPITKFTEKDTITPVESYWNNHVLGISDGIDTVGDIRWELLGYLVVAWVGAYLVVWKGLHNSSKIVWFSAMFPYVILSIL